MLSMNILQHLFMPSYAADKKQSGKHAAICDRFMFRAMISKDFSQYGHCNYYMTEDKFLTTRMAIAAFPVEVKVTFSLGILADYGGGGG